MIITVATPAAHVNDANQLAMALGESAADVRTFGDPNYLDSGGNSYAVASFTVDLVWLTKAMNALEAPAWDDDGSVDLAAASRAQAMLDVWPSMRGAVGAAPTVATDKITAFIMYDPTETLQIMGVSVNATGA